MYNSTKLRESRGKILLLVNYYVCLWTHTLLKVKAFSLEYPIVIMKRKYNGHIDLLSVLSLCTYPVFVTFFFVCKSQSHYFWCQLQELVMLHYLILYIVLVRKIIHCVVCTCSKVYIYFQWNEKLCIPKRKEGVCLTGLKLKHLFGFPSAYMHETDEHTNNQPSNSLVTISYNMNAYL